MVIVAVLSAAALTAARLSVRYHRFFDAKVYVGALRFWFRAGGMVYAWTRPGTRYGFTYPPFAGLLMAPMAFLSFTVVVAAVTAATVLATAMVLRLLAERIIRKSGQPIWFAFLVAVCLALLFEPVQETIGFGQINMLLLALVVLDLRYGVVRGSRWAGVGIGVATAIKLTPGVFVVYLLIAGRWRAAATAAATVAAATVAGAAIAPDTSRVYWTMALWDTSRVGRASNPNNQSLRGLVARLHLGHATPVLWVLLVLLVAWCWLVRVRRAAATGDDAGGFALTGLLGCLISPVTWIHHLVWAVPALVRYVDAVRLPAWRLGRSWQTYLAATGYLILASRAWWIRAVPHGRIVELVPANVYVWLCITLLLLTPVGWVDGRVPLTRSLRAPYP
ncbi:glycosyltransferase 87 family protein [Krasilnikovia sp. MM14-A1259]